MASNVCVPYYEPGGRVTGRATGAAVIGKRFVAIAQKKDLGSRELDSAASGGNIRIIQAAADDAKCFGVAEYDAADGFTTTVPLGTDTVRGMSLSDSVVDGDAIIALYA
jgi:hypothetical protein